MDIDFAGVVAELGRKVRSVHMCPYGHLSTPVPHNSWDLINNDSDGAASQCVDERVSGQSSGSV